MPAVYALTVFFSAALLFLLEPMVGKLLLPTFGGAPAVWNVCLAFYQAVLLAGYCYAHWLTRLARVRRQAILHLAVICLPWLVLPFDTQLQPTPPGSNPTWPLLVRLATTAGMPLFVLASTSPLLSQWFAALQSGAGRDPYWLYAASNAGSMLGLLVYPFFIEPRLSLPTQAFTWANGYAVLVAMLAICMLAAWKGRLSPLHAADTSAAAPAKPSAAAVLGWAVLAFVPSSLLLSVTTFLSSDVSPVPFIWLPPLALYLLSFILVFSRMPRWMLRLFAVALPILVLIQAYQAFTWFFPGPPQPMRRTAMLHLATFFCAAMVCHGELAWRRPHPAFLTSYFFWLSFGGVAGGCFNALLAPLVFKSLAEYPLALSMACALSPLALTQLPRLWKWFDVAGASAVSLTAWLLVSAHLHDRSRWPIVAGIGLTAALAARPVAFGLAVAVLFTVAGQYDDAMQYVIFRERDFYGALKIQTDAKHDCNYFSHGRVLHGQQRRSDDPAVRNKPLVYYYPTGPIGQVFAATPVLKTKAPVAVVGLGVGTLASYGQPGQEFVFYELDPAVERLARDERYFTFLRDSPANCRVVLGDARLSLRDATDGHYGLMVIDAFSGDGVPVHLLTYEAMSLYLEKLAPHGVVVFQLSNTFLDLSAVLGNLARAHSLAVFNRYDSDITAEERDEGKLISQWGIVAREEDDLGALAHDNGWLRLVPVNKVSLWTDHYTSLWPIANWRQ